MTTTLTYQLKMLDFPTSTKHEPKCVVTHGTMGHVDVTQPPTKRKPFASILSQSFIHKVLDHFLLISIDASLT